MKPKNLLLISAVIWGWGGYLLFFGMNALPLWLVWTMGPLCWYLGGAAGLVTGFMTIFHYLATKSTQPAAVPQPDRVELMEFKKLIPRSLGPAGVTREIPPMGGCVI